MSILLWPDDQSSVSDSEDKPSITHQIFQRTDKHDPRRLRLQIVDLKFVSEANSTIYRATLRCDGQTDCDVICKMVYDEPNIVRLANEASFYNCELEPFQGKCVPVFHGMFEFKDGDEDIGMLVLDYVGEHLTEPIFALPWDFRSDRFYSLIICH